MPLYPHIPIFVTLSNQSIAIIKQHRHSILFVLIVGWMLSSFSAQAGCEEVSRNPPVHSIVCDLTFPQAATPDINTVYIPFQLVGQLIMVEAKVDTITGLFIVDTGSEHLVINRKHYHQTGRPVEGIVAAGNTGLVEAVKVHRADSVRLQLLVWKNQFAHIADLSHIEEKKNTRILGMLGYDIFRQFELFIDFPNRRIVLFRTDEAGELIEPDAQWEIPSDSINFSLVHHLIQLDVTVNQEAVKMILDSGAELNLIDRRIRRKVLDHFTIIKRVNLVGVGKREVEVIAGVLRDVRCGGQHTARMNTLLTSLDDINKSFGTRADGVLGYEFLKSRRTLINYTKRKLYFFNPMRS